LNIADCLFEFELGGASMVPYGSLFTKPIIIKFTVTIALSVAGFSSCSEQATESNDSSLQSQSSPGIQWLEAAGEELAARQEIIKSLQRVERIIRGEIPTESLQDPSGAFSLVQLTPQQQVELQARALQNEGIHISNQASRIQNYAASIAAGNRRTELALTNEASSIDNFGKRLNNVSAALRNETIAIENELKRLEVGLRSVYLNMYQNYARSFNRYSQYMFNIYRRADRASIAAARSLRELRNYHRQSNICATRARSVWRRSLTEANQELWERDVSLRNIPRIFSSLAAKPGGEACLHAALLEQFPGPNSELLNIHYQVEHNNRPIELRCPILEDDAQSVDSDLITSEFDLMSYPMPILDEETFEPIGFFQPLTYYQVYRLLTDNEIMANFANAPANDRAVCNRFHPGVRRFMETSHLTERYLSEFDMFSEIDIEAMPLSDSAYLRINQSLRHNRSYMTLIDRMTTIFRKTESCIAQVNTFEEITVEPPEGSFGTDSPSLEARSTAKTVLTSYFDPSLPLMSESVRSCMQLAEHHRYMAFNNIELVEDIFSLFSQMSELNPPRSPAPVQLQPHDAGGHRR